LLVGRDVVTRRESCAVIEAAEVHFKRGTDVVYLSVEEDGRIEVTVHPPERREFVAARSTRQIERFLAELRRRSG